MTGEKTFYEFVNLESTVIALRVFRGSAFRKDPFPFMAQAP